MPYLADAAIKILCFLQTLPHSLHLLFLHEMFLPLGKQDAVSLPEIDQGGLSRKYENRYHGNLPKQVWLFIKQHKSICIYSYNKQAVDHVCNHAPNKI